MRWIVIIVLLLLAAPAARAAGAPGKDVTLLLDVIINGRDTREIVSFIQRDGALFASRRDLKGLGFLVPDSAGATDDSLIALSSLTNVSYRIDQSTQTLEVRARRGGIKADMIGGARENLADMPVQSGTGAVLNYDIVTDFPVHGGEGSPENQPLVNGAVDLRFFDPFGVFDSSFIATNTTADATANEGRTQPVVRLNTGYSYSDPDSLRQYQVGDFINGALSWTRAVRLGGAQIATNFAIRPDLITYPLPSISGEAAVPSSVDVLVNGVRQLSGDVGAGPFQVSQLPSVNGSGDVTVVVKNALGQQVTETLPFYASTTMLAAGLSSYSIEAGSVRREYGVLSDDYGTPAASASGRYGATQWLTLESHAEGSTDLGMGGAGAVFTIGPYAVASISGAASANSGKTGAQYAASIQHVGPVFNVNASIQVDSSAFRDLAALNGDPVPRMILQGGTGVTLNWMGTLGVNYTRIDSPLENDSVVTLSYSRELFRHILAFANAYHDFGGGGNNGNIGSNGSSGFLMGFSIPLGQRSAVTATGGEDGGQASGTVEAQQSVSDVGDFGYQLMEADGQGQSPHEFGLANYKSPYGLFGAGVDQHGSQTTLGATANGALVLADKSLFASNYVYDSFAVVDTNGFGGVNVTGENRPEGRTDSSGQLLVPDLQSFQADHIGIDPNDVPLDADVDSTTRIIRPQDRAGVVVNFPIHRNNSAVVRLVDSAGKDLPVGSIAKLNGTDQAVSVGYDGEIFMQALGAHNVVTVMLRNDGTCTVAFDYHPVPGEIPKIGPFTCRPGSPR